jgi:hypothetical protein
MYLHGPDVRLLLDRIDADSQLAWLASTGEAGCWRALPRHPAPLFARSLLWHVPSGPLPLLSPRRHPADMARAERDWIADPCAGWRERRTGADDSVPYFGAGWPGVYALNLSLRRRGEDEPIGISSFEWIGNRYAPLGDAADPSTARCWRRLRAWTRKHARPVTRSGSLDPPIDRSSDADVLAFPHALEAIQNGTPRAINPTPLRPWTLVLPEDTGIPG